MKKAIGRFNFFLLLFAALLACACATSQEKTAVAGEKPKKRNKNEGAIIRIYLEANATEASRTQTVSVYRDHPISVNVSTQPFLDEFHIVGASVVSTADGPAIRLQLDDTGTKLLDGISSSDRGRRIVIAALFTEGRFLGAPRLNRRISDGVILFIPDATPAEMERIVNGVNNLAEKGK